MCSGVICFSTAVRGASWFSLASWQRAQLVKYWATPVLSETPCAWEVRAPGPIAIATAIASSQQTPTNASAARSGRALPSGAPRLLQRIGDQVRAARAAHGHRDVLLAVEHVGHGRAGLLFGHFDAAGVR